MAACPSRNYDNVTSAVFQCLVSKAAEHGVAISADSGTASKSGFKISWNYDRQAESLTLQCLKKLIVSCNDVGRRMDDAVNACRS